MAPFDLKSTSKLRSALHFRYSIVVESMLGIPSFYLHFCSAFSELFSLYIYRIHTCSAPLAAIDNINTVCEYVIILNALCRIGWIALEMYTEFSV